LHPRPGVVLRRGSPHDGLRRRHVHGLRVVGRWELVGARLEASACQLAARPSRPFEHLTSAP
jgi:hypothetical protein